MSRAVISPAFWGWYLASLCAAHLAGAFGFSLALMAIVALHTLFEASTFPAIAQALITVPLGTAPVFYTVALLMWPVTVMTIPATLLAAAALKTGRRTTTLLGGVAGALLGWPLAALIHDVPVLGSEMIAAFFGGALFAQPVWAWCIRPNAPQAADHTLRSRPALVWVAAAVAALLATLVLG